MRASQGRAYWSSWAMASQSSPLSPDKLMYAATFLKGVNEEVGLVFNTFLTAVTVFSAVFQLGSVGVLWLYVLSAGFAVTLLLQWLIAGAPRANQNYIPWRDASSKPRNCHPTCKSHRRTVFITMLHLHHKNKFFPLFPLVQHDLSSASQTKQGKGGWKQTHLAYAHSDCPDLFAK